MIVSKIGFVQFCWTSLPFYLTNLLTSVSSGHQMSLVFLSKTFPRICPKEPFRKPKNPKRYYRPKLTNESKLPTAQWTPHRVCGSSPRHTRCPGPTSHPGAHGVTTPPQLLEGPAAFTRKRRWRRSEGGKAEVLQKKKTTTLPHQEKILDLLLPPQKKNKVIKWKTCR